MAGIGQRFTSADHTAPWNTQTQYTMGRSVLRDCAKHVTNCGETLNKRALFSTGPNSTVGAPSFSDMAAFCPSGYSSRPGSSQHNGDVLNPATGAFSLRPGYSNAADTNPEDVSSYFNAIGYNGGQSCPPRNFSEPSLFPSLSVVNRTMGHDLGGSRIVGAGISTRPTSESLAINNTRTSGNLFSSGLTSEPVTTNTSLTSSSSRGVKLDPAEFPPILTAVGRGGSSSLGGTFHASSNQPPLRNYVSVMSKGSLGSDSGASPITQFTHTVTSQATPEFSKQDFPALPGQHTSASNTSTSTSLSNLTAASGTIHRSMVVNPSSVTPGSCGSALGTHRTFTQASGSPLPVGTAATSVNAVSMGSGIQLLPNHLVANIPKNMICDQFGMVGLLKLIRVGDYDTTLNMLAPGLDLSTLHNNWQSPGELHSTFVSPCHDSCIGRPQDMDYAVPPEYLIRHLIADRLPDPPMDQLSEETLFWLFYNCCREEAQLVVAKELYQREWRFHKKEQIWLTRIMGANFTTDSNSEQGEYYFWDPFKAQKSTHQMTILYSDLDDAPAAFRVSSNTLSAFVGIGHPMGGASGAHHITGSHSQTNLQQQHLVNYQQAFPHSQSQAMLNRHQVTGGASISSTASHQSSSQLVSAQGGSGSASAATLAGLFNARTQSKPAQLSPTASYFQPPPPHTRSVAVAPLFASRSLAGGVVQSNTPSVSPATTLCSVPVTSSTAAASNSSCVSSTNVTHSLSAVDSNHTNDPTQNRTSNSLGGVEDSGGLQSKFESSHL
ncbi:hypothetical protein CRM22_009314 [Opisthorchis felineus]|uniref:NOT2/NOT3/NOT5 C-terminal domain-containing protein n=1 Tax=Opisthorchis felineus TaxID=147828 RepID=A0A4S2L828_OPIFE|nr:hypothetical protein CRM22_009314 [Opisthorchis felineus]